MSNTNAIETFTQILAMLAGVTAPQTSEGAKAVTATSRKLISKRDALAKMQDELGLDLTSAIGEINVAIAALTDDLVHVDSERGEFLDGLAAVERAVAVMRRRTEGVSFLADFTVGDGDDAPSILDDWKGAKPGAVALSEKEIALHGEREAQVAGALAFLTKGGTIKTTSTDVDELLVSIDGSAAPGMAETYASKFGDVFRRRGKDAEGNSIGVYSVHRA